MIWEGRSLCCSDVPCSCSFFFFFLRGEGGGADFCHPTDLTNHIPAASAVRAKHKEKNNELIWGAFSYRHWRAGALVSIAAVLANPHTELWPLPTTPIPVGWKTVCRVFAHFKFDLYSFVRIRSVLDRNRTDWIMTMGSISLICVTCRRDQIYWRSKDGVIRDRRKMKFDHVGLIGALQGLYRAKH